MQSGGKEIQFFPWVFTCSESHATFCLWSFKTGLSCNTNGSRLAIINAPDAVVVLAPQLQQSLALLQAPTLELKALVEQECSKIPCWKKWRRKKSTCATSRNAIPMKWPTARSAERRKRWCLIPCRKKVRKHPWTISGGIRQTRATGPGMARSFFADQHSHPPDRRRGGKAPVHVRLARVGISFAQMLMDQPGRPTEGRAARHRGLIIATLTITATSSQRWTRWRRQPICRRKKSPTSSK